MHPSTPINSTNVRTGSFSPAAIALALWVAFVAVLGWTGALDRLHDDLPIVTLFAGGVAALAYGVDAEVRRAARGTSSARLAIGWLAIVAAMSLHATVLLALAPAAVVLAAAGLARALEARFRSTAAGSPGVKPGAP